eukprot:68884-Pyramimonas_sp.AAC.1
MFGESARTFNADEQRLSIGWLSTRGSGLRSIARPRSRAGLAIHRPSTAETVSACAELLARWLLLFYGATAGKLA